MKDPELGNGEEQGALFVTSMPASGQSGPVAVWITAVGWAAAARRKLGRAWIMSPEGIHSPEEARLLAAHPGLMPRAQPAWRPWVPEIAVTAVKDVHKWVKNQTRRRPALDGLGNSSSLVFVWQHHDLFQTTGFRLARALERPLVLHVDAPVVWEAHKWGTRRPGWGRLAERLGEVPQFRAADVIACVSEEVAEQVAKRGVPTDRILVTPCSVDLDLFQPEVSTAALRERLGLRGKFVIGWAGSFRRFHGLELLLRAASHVQTLVPDSALLLVGDGSERHRMEEFARELKIRDAVFTGTVPYEQMPTYIGMMDVAVLPSPKDQEFHYSPLKIREYMACGKAIVAARVGQVGRTLGDEAEALLVEPGDAGAMATAIERIHRDFVLGMALGIGARRKVAREGSWDSQLEKVMTVLEMRGPRAVNPSWMGRA